MAEEKLLTVRDVALILGISEKEVVDLTESGKIPAYKVGGVYLRFQREQIEGYRKSLKPHLSYKPAPLKQYSFKDRLIDFFYFNDFYVLAVIVIILILFVILRGY